ncbi:hypothetical protein [Thermophilibacter provencensis]|uniref:DUF4825 domain-containing protein n=1 Tax=Thermophilibacter provencensis TaxID=1852386 RepID=A0ABT7V3G0_9ACTN|nr:hypothetical protein [Thermophilibacter provencensis]MDM8271132.1 hypothetical protein [Thermophilibacter provencensis]
MSGRSDIRMYVEHLFEGRTLDAETIELKEEIYGNLVARFDDYVAQGMGEDEAYARTCEAVTSVDDVMGEKDAGDKDDPLDATVAAPAAAVAPEPEPTTVIGTPEPPASQGAPAGAQTRWSTGMIVAVVAVVLLVAGIAGCTVFNLLDTQRGLEDYQSQTSQTVQPVDQPDDTTYTDDAATGDAATGQTTGNNATSDDATSTSPNNGSAPQDGTGNRYGAPSQSGTGLTAEVRAHSVDELTGYAGTALSDAARVEELVRALPVGEYVTGVTADPATKTVEVTYTYQDRDLVARDDDHVDLALVYDAVALMSTLDGMDTLRMVEIEDDGYEYDRGLQVFERSMLEWLLGVTLDASQLTAEAWESVRGQVMTEYVYEEAWDRAERS